MMTDLPPPPPLPPLARQPLPPSAGDEAPYQDLQGMWPDLEAALSLVLARPALVHNLPAKISQLDLWLKELIAQDTDSALYVTFQIGRAHV